jgi:hypothetical protein
MSFVISPFELDKFRYFFSSQFPRLIELDTTATHDKMILAYALRLMDDNTVTPKERRHIELACLRALVCDTSAQGLAVRRSLPFCFDECGNYLDEHPYKFAFIRSLLWMPDDAPAIAYPPEAVPVGAYPRRSLDDCKGLWCNPCPFVGGKNSGHGFSVSVIFSAPLSKGAHHA